MMMIDVVNSTQVVGVVALAPSSFLSLSVNLKGDEGRGRSHLSSFSSLSVNWKGDEGPIPPLSKMMKEGILSE